jgi:hypothetical protein
MVPVAQVHTYKMSGRVRALLDGTGFRRRNPADAPHGQDDERPKRNGLDGGMHRSTSLAIHRAE